MDEFQRERNAKLAERVIKGLASRNMAGYYAPDKAAALEIAMSLIPTGSTVTMGGGMSVWQIGLPDALKAGDYNFIDRAEVADPRQAMLAAYDADVFLASTNAITEDGQLVNIDGNANRVSAMAYGPKRLVLVVGVNKVCKDLDGAMKRARNVAAPTNAQRFDLSTPCSRTGTCADCLSPDTVCCQFLITRYSRHKGRIPVILVNENLGY